MHGQASQRARHLRTKRSLQPTTEETLVDPCPYESHTMTHARTTTS